MGRITEREQINILVGERVRECRKAKGMKRSELVERIYLLPENEGKNRSEKQIGYIENGDRKLSSDYAKLIAKVLGVRVEYLLMEDDYPTNAHRAKEQYAKAKQAADSLYNEFLHVANMNGYEFETILHGNQPVEKWLEAIDQYYTVKKNGEIIGTCSVEQYNRLANFISKLVGTVFENFECEVK